MVTKRDFMVGLIFLSSLSIDAKPVSSQKVWSVTQMQRNIVQHLPPVLASILVGAGTGSLVRYIEKELQIEQSPEFIVWLAVAWYAEFLARTGLMESVQQDLDDAHIPHKKNIMNWSAWLASWFAYINV